MKASRKAKLKRNEDIRKEFKELESKHLQFNYIYQTIADKYALEPLTVKAIVKQHKKYRIETSIPVSTNDEYEILEIITVKRKR